MDPRLMALITAYQQGLRPPSVGGLQPDKQMQLFGLMYGNTVDPRTGNYVNPQPSYQYPGGQLKWLQWGGRSLPAGRFSADTGAFSGIDRGTIDQLLQNSQNPSGWGKGILGGVDQQPQNVWERDKPK